ncbi:MAG TPA: DUF6600 domain-containing protein [Thermoanaerobaculia bacterium]|nr:DUF6600 domain-containing protein [Thermoanaerobaculia bacterium]
MKVAATMRTLILLSAALCAAAAPGRAAAYEPEQGFFRVVESDATLVRIESGEPEAARENTPALTGDRVWLSPGARVEIILPDSHRVRLGESADLELVALARSLDEESETTVLLLHSGALALDVPSDLVRRTRVDTDNATLYLEPDGLYLIEADEAGYTRVVVRAGRAELVTARDAARVEAGEQAEASPDPSERVARYEAPALTEVELWAENLEAEAARADLGALEPELRYAALPLARHGAWLETDGRYAWRPRVTAGWQPYWSGYWTYSPAGLVWSSYEPWGWVPYHYGAWDLHPSYGWLWYPGAAYAPAHVVWYWGPSHVAWIPAGYYRGFYARRFGFHASFGTGFHGVSYADWRAYRHWTFCPVSSIGFSHQHRFHRDHRVLAHHDRFPGHRRAFITADTRGLERGRWRDTRAVEGAVLRRAHRHTGAEPRLADVSAVIARSPEVSGSLLRDLDRGGGPPRVASHRPTGLRAASPDGSSADRSRRPAAGVASPSPRVAGSRPVEADRRSTAAAAPPQAARRAVPGAPRAEGADARISRPEAGLPPARSAVPVHRSPSRPAGAPSRSATVAQPSATAARPALVDRPAAGTARPSYSPRTVRPGIVDRGRPVEVAPGLADRQRGREAAAGLANREPAVESRAVARRPQTPAYRDRAPSNAPPAGYERIERRRPAAAPGAAPPAPAAHRSAAQAARPSPPGPSGPARSARSPLDRAASSAPRALPSAPRPGGRAATSAPAPAPRVERAAPAPSAPRTGGASAAAQSRGGQPRSREATGSRGSSQGGGRHARPH